MKSVSTFGTNPGAIFRLRRSREALIAKDVTLMAARASAEGQTSLIIMDRHADD